jgi:hypothetical protein
MSTADVRAAGRRTRTSSLAPSTASVDVRRPAHHARESRLVPSRGAAKARPPTPFATRSEVCSFRDVLSWWWSSALFLSMCVSRSYSFLHCRRLFTSPTACWRSNAVAAPLFRERPLRPALMRKIGRAGAVFVGWKSASAKGPNERYSSACTSRPFHSAVMHLA